MSTLAAGFAAVRAIPPEYGIFGLTLLGVALFHRHTLLVALVGLSATLLYKMAFGEFASGPGTEGLIAHLRYEAVLFSNLMLLIVGFGLLASQFEKSNLPEAMPRVLPDGWTGGLALLAMVFVLSALLDNIAATVIGGVVARHVYQGRVSIGFLAALVAAANAGGAGSVIGDTTTTMMWISGVSPLAVLKAFIAAGVAFLVFGVVGAIQQHRYAPIRKHADTKGPPIDRVRVIIVGLVLLTLLAVNFAGNAWYPEHQDRAPWLGLSLWFALLVTAVVRWPGWNVIPGAARSALFLVTLVATASLMPVESLPEASWPTAAGLGVLSSVFDNIPLTALALKQGGYDWGVLAFAVGFGGSMMWFGSSAGVALSTQFPEARSVWSWLRYGWHVPVAYVAGFAAMLHLTGWVPGPTRADLAPGESRSAPPKLVDDTLHRAGELWRGGVDRAIEVLRPAEPPEPRPGEGR